ncbi:hypothetical protein NPIL_594771 [Nephila pilipes]|uniref:Uncharacterized protein n=1 Tax=Nephila pilipes TaxID=299642 RepID=A0A8X6P2F2_NEPPI|nr:hypothetical protein NPIL_594771 [Nephila pilipes]
MLLVQRLKLQDIYVLQRVDFRQEMTKPVLIPKTEDLLVHAMDVWSKPLYCWRTVIRDSQIRGVDFQKTQLTMSLAERTKNEVEAYTTCVDVGLQEESLRQT